MFRFKYIRLLGRVSKPNRYFKFHEIPYRLDEDVVAKSLLGHTPTQGVVRTTKLNYVEAVMGFDRPLKIPDNEFFTIARQYLLRFLSGYIQPTRPRYKDLYMNYATGCGFPGNIIFPDKASFPEEWIALDVYGEYEPYIWCLAMKKEKLNLIKILEKNKMRSFMMAFVGYLVRQKKYSQDFNEGMKKVPWSAYGFNWHNKGMDELVSNIKNMPFIYESDISYWDKAFGLKRICYEVREQFLILTDHEREEFWQMAHDEINPTVVLPTGELIQLPVGQCSGSENTTSDNTLGHILIQLYEAVKGYYETYGGIPTLAMILENVFPKDYSDDNITGVTLKFSFMADPIRKNAIFQEFGMAVEYNNPEKWKMSRSLEGHTFLGFTIHNYFGTFVPTYDYEKIKDSSIVRESGESPKQQLTRFTQLLELLTFTEQYEEYKEFIKRYAIMFNLPEPFLESQRSKQAFELCLEINELDALYYG